MPATQATQAQQPRPSSSAAILTAPAMPGRGRDDPSYAALQVASLPSYLFPQPSARVRARTLTKPGPLLSRFPVCNIVYTQTLEQVWTVVEKDLEANLLIFLEQLFALEPSVVRARPHTCAVQRAALRLRPCPRARRPQVSRAADAATRASKV